MTDKKVIPNRIPIDMNPKEETFARNRRDEYCWNRIENTSMPKTISVICPYCQKEVAAMLYDECCKAYGSGCYTATVILARTLLNHIAVDQGSVANKEFKFYVDYLIESYMPRKAGKWLDLIRKLANESTHKLRIINNEEAALILKFTMYLLKYIYELPNELV